MKRSLSFEEVLASLPEATGELLAEVVTIANEQKLGIHLVGGPVRDLLLGRSVADVDVVVESDVRELGEQVAQQWDHGEIEIEAHDRFGTLRLVTADAQVDLARLRSETYAHSGALPDVVAGSLEQDLRRRDFSVNALTCLLDAGRADKEMPVVDLNGGLEDLAARRLRVLHPRSFHDDPTRAFRAARFAARLGFSLERSSRAALRDALRDGAFGAVSGERWRRELQLAFDEARRGVHVGHILRSLSGWHVLSALEPGLQFGGDRMAPLRRLSRAIENPEWVAPRSRAWVAGLSIWLAPLPTALRRRTLDRFSIRGEQAKRIIRFAGDAERLLRSLPRARGRGAVDATLAELPEETVQAVYALADPALRRRILRWGAEDRRRRAPVGGGELSELGLEGPDVGRALARIRAGFLDGEVANREEALALAEEIAKRLSRRRAARPAGSPRRRSVARRSTIADTPGVEK